MKLDDLPSATGAFWMTTYESAFAIDVAKGKVMRAASVARWAVGKQVTVLIAWAGRQGGLKVERLHRSALDPPVKPEMPTVINADGVI